MDIEAIRVWLQVINMLGTFALGAWLYLEKRSDKTNSRVTDLEKKMSGLDTDLTRIESTCKACTFGDLSSQIGELEKDVSALKTSSENAPNHGDLSKVYESVRELAKEVNQLVGEFEVQGQTLRQILNRIIEKGMP